MFGFLFGQLPPCCTSPGVPFGCQIEAGTSAVNSCIICSPAGIFIGNNKGCPPSGVWLSVIADISGNIDAIVLTSNCVTGDGLQLALWDNAGNEIVPFSGNSGPTATVSHSGGIPGALYHFQIKGFDGDVCDYTLVITRANHGIIPDPVSGFVADPDTILCPGAEVCFSIDNITNATKYNWGSPSNMSIIDGGGPNDLFMCCLVESAGGGVAKVTPANFCFNGFPAILPTVAVPIPPAIWLPIMVCNMPWDTVFKEQTYSFDQYGANQITVVTELGCDSIINLSILPNVQTPLILDSTIRGDSCLIFNDSCYFEGSHIVNLTNKVQQNGCDSTINLIVNTDCLPIEVLIDSIPNAFCAGDSIEIQFTATNDSPNQNGTYTWSGNGVSKDGKFNTAGLHTGEYSIVVGYLENGCHYQSVQQIKIEPSPEIEATVNQPIWKLGGLGSIYFSTLNGVRPDSIIGPNGAIERPLNNLIPGKYCVSVTGENLCEAQECYEIKEGIYEVSPLHVICAGDRQPLFVSPEIGATFSWSPAIGLSCTDCASPIANPRKSTTYTVTATMLDGRSSCQNVLILVLPRSVCNFSPKAIDESVNQLFTGIEFENVSQENLEILENEIIDLFLENEVKIAPNPTNGKVQIFAPEQIESVEVFDVSGKKVVTFFKKNINVTRLPKGVYFLRIKIKGRILVRRIVMMG